MLNVVMLSLTNKHFMLSVIMLIVVMLCVINKHFMLSVINKHFMLNVIMLNVEAPKLTRSSPICGSVEMAIATYWGQCYKTFFVRD
jgi:hypothetical protein